MRLLYAHVIRKAFFSGIRYKIMRSEIILIYSNFFLISIKTLNKKVNIFVFCIVYKI